MRYILILFALSVLISLGANKARAEVCIDFGDGTYYCTSPISPFQGQLYQTFLPVIWK